VWHRLVAALYDRMLAPVEDSWLREKRRELLRWSQGQVLEIGGGTGANLPCYRESGRLVFTDPDPAMLGKSTRRLYRHAHETVRVQCRAENLPFGSGTFDTVVATLVLCSVSNPARSLAEIGRVLKSGGRFLFLEHTRGEESIARWQDRLTPVWSRLALGCHLNRDTVSLIQNAGFHVARLERHHPPVMPRLFHPTYVGVALNKTGRSVSRDEFQRSGNIGAQGGSR